MTTEEIEAFRKAKPFRPFRVKTTLGETFEVNSPEHIFVSGHMVLIGVGISQNSNIPDGFEHRGIDFIASVEERIRRSR